MTDIVNVSPGHIGTALENARTFQYGGHTDGWVVPEGEEKLAPIRAELEDPPYGQFATSSSGNSHIVTVSSGEAVVGGVLLARDTVTDVELEPNEFEQMIYVGWAHQSQDTVIVGTESDFADDNPKIPLAEFDMDGSGMADVRIHRDLGHQIDVKNVRYESGGEGKVAEAGDADTVGGISPTNFLRSDESDILRGQLALGARYAGEPHSSVGERLRWGNGPENGDGMVSVGSNFGRFCLTWNAYWDSQNGVWRSISPDEPHALIGLASYIPGGNDWAGGNVVIARAGRNDSSGDEIDWQFIELDDEGKLDMNMNEIIRFKVGHSEGRPGNPEPGQLIYRPDKD